jgi:hypothetical protein
MPVCQKCQTPYDEWQHFCLNCGAYLKEGPLPLLRCPKCGTGLETMPGLENDFAAPAQEAEVQMPKFLSWKWLGAVLAAVLGLGVIFVWVYNRGPSRNPVLLVESTARPEIVEKATAGGKKEAMTPPAAVRPTQAEVERLLINIREANLTKNILLFMDTLSKAYPQPDKKREEVVKTWKNFDFREMAYTVGNVQEVEQNKAIAEVKWTTTSQNLATKNWQTAEYRYRVWVTNELGQWKIKKIEEIP